MAAKRNNLKDVRYQNPWEKLTGIPAGYTELTSSVSRRFVTSRVSYKSVLVSCLVPIPASNSYHPPFPREAVMMTGLPGEGPEYASSPRRGREGRAGGRESYVSKRRSHPSHAMQLDRVPLKYPHATCSGYLLLSDVCISFRVRGGRRSHARHIAPLI